MKIELNTAAKLWPSPAGKEAGILLHLTSLPSRYGVGDLGSSAFVFIDFLKAASQSLWQVLPLNPPGYGYSPYQCYSAFALNPLFLDPDALKEEGLLKAKDIAAYPCFPEGKVDYEGVEKAKEELLRQAFKNFSARNLADYLHFSEGNRDWLDDYALFMALKKVFNGETWNRWEKPAASRQEGALASYRHLLSEEIEFQRFLQYYLFKQWRALKKYAAAKGVKLIGDLPIFVSHDSSDVWANPRLFRLDKEGEPAVMAGVPPDYFSETGQLWGNPHYNWEEMKRDGYQWWLERIAQLRELVDIIRLDHFRGFESYWEVPQGAKTAAAGRWVKGPGQNIFRTIKIRLGKVPFIAEDLGIITPEVSKLKKWCGYPGMQVLQFLLEEKPQAEYFSPAEETVFYTGTHDNDTIWSWYEKVFSRQKIVAGEKEDICRHFIEMVFRSAAAAVIIPLQDLLCLGGEARMNTPGTVGGNNWRWRFRPGDLQGMEEKLHALTQKCFEQKQAPEGAEGSPGSRAEEGLK